MADDAGRPRLSFRQVERVRVADLRATPGNARTHGRAQIKQIAASIRRFGFTNPILCDKANTIIAGHGRWLAAKDLKLRFVPVIRLEHLTPDELRAYALADNRLAEKAGWDEELLALQLKELSTLDLDFDIELTGFEQGEIDLKIAKLADRGGQREIDEAADICAQIDRTMPATAGAGDLWQLGPHLLAVGDARDGALLARLMQGALAAAVITDPPYNVRIPGFASGKGQAKHKDFVMASGEMSAGEYSAFLERSLAAMSENVVSGGYVTAFIDWRHVAQLIRAAEGLGLRLLNICVWVKPRGGMGSLYRSQHELVAVFATGESAGRNNIQLGRFGRNRTNVWHYAGPNPLRPDGQAELNMHPTVKPVAMIADAILDMTARGDLVLDPFAGSGTIFIAAEKTGRRARGCEIDPHYADACIRRWQDYTGKTAQLVETGETFEQAKRRRSQGCAGLAGKKRVKRGQARKAKGRRS